ncbi:MAG TPA: 6-bladed beta-propeller [Rectinemataceae bacterium]|nr:6-bladed beta-propeller [Rectinemataceae bacterium]
MKCRSLVALILVVLVGPPALAQFNSELDSPGAAEQLRLGVQAFNRGRFGESILLLEKALAYAPKQSLISYWLGRAYFKSGFEETALRAWQPLLEMPDAIPSLRAKMEIIRASRSIPPATEAYRYVEVARFEGRRGKDDFFLRPSAILPRRDGSILVVAHGSNELVTIDAGGIVRRRDRGGLAGFDGPFGAAALPDGTLFVTEFGGDRIARIAPGGKVTTFGGKGRGPGTLLGPQFAAADAAGYLYVADYGNARVSKYDSEGNFVLSFGDKQPESGFGGLASPAGILVQDAVVYIADSLRRAIYRFDLSGNYLGAMAEGELHFPEGLASWQSGRELLVSDTDRVVSIDLGTEATRLVYSSPDPKARIVGAAPDFNGNLAICDFDASVVSLLSESSLIASGYDVEIERIVSDAFPVVDIDVNVRDRNGAPVVGLREGNFYLTERIKRTTQSDESGKTVLRKEETLVPAADLSLVGAGQVPSGSRTTILVERSKALSPQLDGLRSALIELYRVLGAEGAKPSLVTAGAVPALESAGDITAAVRAATAPAAGNGRIDLGLRLAATGLLPSGSRDAVVYLGTGQVDEASFTGTTLSELAALLRNNGIRFYAVVLGQPSPGLRYLVERTGGAIYAADRPRGLGDLGADLRSAPSGRYRLRFTSKADSEFGKAYLSVGIEAYLYKKSGKDELGYYAPLR